MKKPFCFIGLVVGGFCLAGCAEEGPAGPVPEQPYVEPHGRGWFSPYADLMSGQFSLYVGIVRSNRNDHLAREMGYSAPVIAEHGVMNFKVEKTLWGDRKDELVLPYGFTRDDLGAAEPLPSDWGGGYIWDYNYPAIGQRFILLIRTQENGKPVPASSYSEEGFIEDIWKLQPNDPLVAGFEEALKYLAAKDPERRRELFRNLCRSRLNNILNFTCDAAFFARDPSSQDRRQLADPIMRSELVGDFLRLADPTFFNDFERRRITGYFAKWLRKPDAERVTDNIRGAFEDWYLTELACAAVPERRLEALRGLCTIVEGTDGLGATETAKLLFRKGGRGPLLKRLEECSHSTEAHVREKSEELLKWFRLS